MFDMTALYPLPEFSKIHTDIYADWVASSSNNPDDAKFAGQVIDKYQIERFGTYFSGHVEGFNTGPMQPEIDFTSATNNGNDFIVAKVTEDVSSPGGSSNADWQEMQATSGGLASKVLLIETVGGGLTENSSVSISRHDAAAVARS